MSEYGEIFQEALTGPDPFALPKELRGKMKSCCQSGVCAEKIEYLWINLENQGPTAAGIHPPTLEHWLNVVDEAASLGATWLAITVRAALADSPDVIEVAKWAQDGHGMTVAIHTPARDLSVADLAALKQLDLSRVRLCVSESALAQMKAYEDQGVKVRLAEAPGDTHGCGMPQNMLFVNGQGQIYTCGRVKGNDAFHMGNIYNRPFRRVVGDPSLPHAIPVETPYQEHACDGCPPLLASALKSA